MSPAPLILLCLGVALGGVALLALAAALAKGVGL